MSSPVVLRAGCDVHDHCAPDTMELYEQSSPRMSPREHFSAAVGSSKQKVNYAFNRLRSTSVGRRESFPELDIHLHELEDDASDSHKPEIDEHMHIEIPHSPRAIDKVKEKFAQHSLMDEERHTIRQNSAPSTFFDTVVDSPIRHNEKIKGETDFSCDKKTPKKRMIGFLQSFSRKKRTN